MTVALWVLQVVAALGFLAAGANKLLKSREALIANPAMAWANDVSAPQIKLAALGEVVGAAGLILPGALHVLPVLTPVAALCLDGLMLGAVMLHVRRKESAVPAAILGTIALAIAVGRFAYGW